ncbi:hypothetical protein GCM10025857_06650 [Alicyclobacillus contaminans]|uniref:DUF1003 domain-containing protein n=1 Tax=Alicyclobacillus contaminans TaxID=392016 RepID=UPI0004197A0F|nr:DUF1003 domain-containing protein [Alicyclobacillus contaminans]GMA49308.1 hypothetical protein GCM10025857_06650 [Alicyclobacillus contaminans]
MYNRGIKLLARWMTSPSFVAFFFGLIGFWIAFNSFSPWKFDPAPFMALNLVMSALAGIQATATSVAQKEQEKYMLHLLEATSHMLAALIAAKGGDDDEEGQTNSSD